MTAPNFRQLTSLAVTMVSVLLLSLSGVTLAAANGSKEVQTAIEHAGFAGNAKATDQVHLHLHHVINCLVGPKGKDYYVAAGDPCKGEGGGALNDVRNPAQQKYLQQALALAKTGVTISHQAPARNVAVAVGDLLKEAHTTMQKSNKVSKGY
jgi:hypothetical protein